MADVRPSLNAINELADLLQYYEKASEGNGNFSESRLEADVQRRRLMNLLKRKYEEGMESKTDRIESELPSKGFSPAGNAITEALVARARKNKFEGLPPDWERSLELMKIFGDI
jgi:hypothetical protein